MTRAEGRALLAIYVNKANVNTRWQDPEFNLALEHANRAAWKRGMRHAPERWTAEGGWTWAANVFSYDLSGATQLNSDFMRIRRVFETDLPGAMSGTVKLKRIIRKAHNEAFFDALLGGQQGLVGGLYYYHVNGKTLEIAPVPDATMYIRVRYLPKPPNLSSAAGAVPLDSNFLLSPIADPAVVWHEEHHEYVVLRAALRMWSKVGGMPAELMSLLKEEEAEFDEDFAEDVSGEPDYIEDPHGVDTENWAG